MPTCTLTEFEIEKYRLGDGDIVFARTGATTGKSFLVRQPPESVFASYLIRIRLGDDADPAFVALFFQSSAYWQQIESGKRGVGQPNVNASVLAEVELRLPSINEQRAIVAEVERRLAIADRTAAEIDVQLARAARLRQAILKRAFEGKLVPQDPADEPAGVLLDRIRAERAAGAEAPRRGGRQRRAAGKHGR